jgi:dolichol-phosphate mannosyltransferase
VTDQPLDLSVILPADGETEHLAALLPQVHSALTSLSITYEIIIADCQADDSARQVIQQNDARLLGQAESGYGAALVAGIRHAAGEYIITMDPDQAHPASFLRDLWMARSSGDVVIASRYIPGGRASMPLFRTFVSKMLNTVFSRGLDLHVRDMSSGFRLYKTHIVHGLESQSKDYDVLQEILVQILMEGYQIREIPFSYNSRSNKTPYLRLIKFGLAYLKTFARL